MDFITSHPALITTLIFAAFSIAISIEDIRTMHVSDFLIFMGIIVMACYRFACTRDVLLLYLLTALLSVLMFMMVRSVSKRGMGWADVKYSALCALYAGPAAVFLGYLVAAASCAATFGILKRARGRDKSKPLPFTPFMAGGTLIVGAVPIVKGLIS